MTYTPSDSLDSFGHFFVAPVSGPQLDEIDKRMLSELKPAGIILMPEAFDPEMDYTQLRNNTLQLIKDVKEYAERKSLIVSIDHEGGRVHRMQNQLTHFPYADAYAKQSFEVGKAIARELRSIGANLNFAPVVDIHSNPENPVIGPRAFGSSPEDVIEASFEFIRGHDEHQIISCVKHFPGHGDTSTDSHKELPVLPYSLDELTARELVPFIRHIEAGIPMVMIAHLLIPSLDEDYPTSFSKATIKRLLREKLQFSGIAITDDLAMQAVSDGLKDESLLGKSFEAGMDMFCIAKYHKDKPQLHPLKLAECLAGSLKSRKVTEQKCIESYNRVQDLLDLTVGEMQPLTEEETEEHLKLVHELPQS